MRPELQTCVLGRTGGAMLIGMRDMQLRACGADGMFDEKIPCAALLCAPETWRRIRSALWICVGVKRSRTLRNERMADKDAAPGKDDALS